MEVQVKGTPFGNKERVELGSHSLKGLHMGNCGNGKEVTSGVALERYFDKSTKWQVVTNGLSLRVQS